MREFEDLVNYYINLQDWTEELNSEKKIDELRKELYEYCDQSKTSRKGIEYLVNYYINSLGWTEESALIYAIGLFRNDTIRQIKLFGKDN